MKILTVIDQYDSGNNGATISAQRFARGLRERGHRVRVAAAGDPALEKYAQPAIRFPRLADNIIRSQGMLLARPDREVLEEAVRWAGVVHFMMPFALSRAGFASQRSRGNPAPRATVSFPSGGPAGPPGPIWPGSPQKYPASPCP